MRTSVANIEPRAQSITCTEESLSVHLMDGRKVIVPLSWYPRLRHGSEKERNNFEIIGEGTYIHWTDLDEDLTVAGILEGRRSAESAASLRKWLSKRKSRLQANATR